MSSIHFQFVAVIALLVAAAKGDNPAYASPSSRSAPASQPIAIVRSVNNVAGSPGFEDTFNFEFETENGIKQTTQGETRTVDNEDVMVMRGAYSYVDADGQDVTVTWYADETGYHAESSILPVAPAIPFEEQRIAVEAQIRFAAEEAASASRSSSASNNYQSAASNSYQAAAPAPAPAPAPVARQQEPVTYYVSRPAAPVPAQRAAPAVYYRPIESAPEQAQVVAVRQEPAQAYYVPAASAPAPIQPEESPAQPSYIQYLYNN